MREAQTFDGAELVYSGAVMVRPFPASTKPQELSDEAVMGIAGDDGNPWSR